VRPQSLSPEEAIRYRREKVEFGLAYRCPDCLHVARDGRVCAFGYPNRPLLDAEAYLEERDQYIFCKYFELG
jgi:hypothetical protein